MRRTARQSGSCSRYAHCGKARRESHGFASAPLGSSTYAMGSDSSHARAVRWADKVPRQPSPPSMPCLEPSLPPRCLVLLAGFYLPKARSDCFSLALAESCLELGRQVCASKEIEGGAFYLDRAPRVKHIAGAFFSEGSFTKNTEAEVDRLVGELASACQSEIPKTADTRDAM